MSDIFDVMSQGIPANITTKSLSKTQQITSPILYTSVEDIKDIEYTFIIDKMLTNREVFLLQKVLDKKLDGGYQILYALQVKLTEKDLQKTIWLQYANYAWDYQTYIPKYSKVFSFGRTLFSLTKSNDMDCSLVRDEDSDDNSKKKEKLSIIQGFYDTILWKTSFFHPDLKCEIYPVDAWDDLIHKDNGVFKNSFEYWFFTKQITLAKAKSISHNELPKVETIYIDDPNAFLKEHSDNKEVTGFDIETNTLDPWMKGAKIRCVTISFESNPYVGYFLPFEKVNKFILQGFLKNRPLVGTNIKFDIKFMNVVAKISLDYLKIYSDTMQLQHISNEMMRKGLKAGAWLWTPFGGYDKELDDYLGNHPEINNDYYKIPDSVLVPYATTDPCVSLLVHKELCKYRDELDTLVNKNNPYGYGLKWAYEEVIIPTLNLFVEAEITGMTLDMDILKQRSLELQSQVKDLEKEIRKDLGVTPDFKVSSSQQLGEKLESLGWPIFERGDKNAPKVGESQLIEWEKKGFTLATKILKFRQISKLLSTYVGVEEETSGMYKWIRDDGRIHTSYNNFLALSWRHTSGKPNGQNFVSHGEKAKLIRSFITPNNSPDYAFLSTDYSGLQLRLAAMLSDDEQMVRAFKLEGGDIHMRTGFNVMLKYMTEISSVEEAQKIRKGEGEIADYVNDIRFKSKGINFGLLFGAQASTLMAEAIKPNWNEKDADSYIRANKLMPEVKDHYLNITNNDYKFIRSQSPSEDMLNAKYYTIAIDVRKKFFEAYSGLLAWIDNSREEAKKKGYVVSIYGAIRRVPYLLINTKEYDIDYGRFSNLLNIVLNSPIQNMEAIVINRSLVKIWGWLKETKRLDKLFAQIHDAQEYYMHFTEEKEWKEYITKVHEINEMDYPEYKGIPLEVESNLADYYGKQELWDMGPKINPKKF